MNDGRWLIRFSRENTCQAPSAAIENPFSTYLIGACIDAVSLGLVGPVGLVVWRGKTVSSRPFRSARPGRPARTEAFYVGFLTVLHQFREWALRARERAA